MLALLSQARDRRLLGIIRRLGLTTNLRLVFDAGDSASYSGSGTVWNDIAPAGEHFDFGATTAAPTFNGTAGRLSSAEYMSFDGGDYFTKSSANSAWIDALHQDNAAFSVVCMFYPAAVTSTQAILGTDGGNNSSHGISVFVDTSSRLDVQVRNGSGSTALSQNSGSATVTTGAWNFLGLSLNEATGAGGILYRVNGNTEEADSSTYTSPSAVAASNRMQIGARGNNVAPIVNGGRIGCLAMWSGARSSAQLTSLYGALRGRYGI